MSRDTACYATSPRRAIRILLARFLLLGCDDDRGTGVSDDTVFESALVRIGAFRCDADHAAFQQSAPIVNNCVWFTRTPVIIQPEVDRAFIANATTATFDNRGQSFARRRVAERGDESDWFAVDESLVRGIVETHWPRGQEHLRPFPWSHVAIDSATFFRQRRLCPLD